MKVFLVEDEPKVARLIERCLVEEGHQVDVSGDGSEAIRRLTALSPDAIILDVMLPGASGIEVCRAIRARRPDSGILMLSAKGSVTDRIEGLAAGADDYMVKPFALAELLLRLQAIERRIVAPARPESVARTWHFDQLRHELVVGDRTLCFTPREAALLQVFLCHIGATLTRAELAEKAWKISFDSGTNQIDVYINYLRRKLEPVGWGNLIETERGLGYRFGTPPDASVRL